MYPPSLERAVVKGLEQEHNPVVHDRVAHRTARANRPDSWLYAVGQPGFFAQREEEKERRWYDSLPEGALRAGGCQPASHPVVGEFQFAR